MEDAGDSLPHHASSLQHLPLQVLPDSAATRISAGIFPALNDP